MDIQKLHCFLSQLLVCGVPPNTPATCLVNDELREVAEIRHLSGRYYYDASPFMVANVSRNGSVLALVPENEDIAEILNANSHRELELPINPEQDIGIANPATDSCFQPMKLNRVDHVSGELVTYTILGYFEYACFKAAFYMHPEERDFVVFQYENKNKEANSMVEFTDLGSARDYYEAAVYDMLRRTSRSMVQDTL